MLNSITRDLVQVEVLINTRITKTGDLVQVEVLRNTHITQANTNVTLGSAGDENTQLGVAEIFCLLKQIKDKFNILFIVALA